MKALLILALLCATLPPDEWLEFRTDNFQLSYPAHWNFYKNKHVEGNFSWNSPLSNREDGFSENVNLLMQDLSGLGINLDRYVEISGEQLQTLDNFSLLKSKREGRESAEFHVVHYTYHRESLKLYVVQHYYIRGQKAFILTFTSEQQSYASFKDTGHQILRSFQLY